MIPVLLIWLLLVWGTPLALWCRAIPPVVVLAISGVLVCPLTIAVWSVTTRTLLIRGVFWLIAAPVILSALSILCTRTIVCVLGLRPLFPCAIDYFAVETRATRA